jgi:transposase
MRILGLDLGTPTSKTAASLLDTDTGERERTMVPTHPSDLMRLVRHWSPHRVVVEATHATGWVVDLLRALDVAVQVVNPRDPAWVNRTVKTDRQDADLLTLLSASGQVRTVVIPSAGVRHWRSLITYRQRLIASRTRVKNHIKAILRRQGLSSGRLWTAEGLANLRSLARPLGDCLPNDYWRGELDLELRRLADAESHVATLSKQLDRIGQSDPRVRLLMEQDGVGPRLAEAVVAFIDQPQRFATGKQVGAYAGLATRVHQSGQTSRMGGITRMGNPVLRSLLVEVAWLAIRHDGWMRDAYVRTARGDPQRRQRAIVAVARRLLIRLWATLRDGAARPPARTPIAA